MGTDTSRELELLAWWRQRMRHKHAFGMRELVRQGLATVSEETDENALYEITEAGRQAFRARTTPSAASEARPSDGHA